MKHLIKPIAPRRKFQIACAALLLSAMAPAAITATPVTGTCSPSKAKYSASTVMTVSSLTTYHTITEGAVVFTQGGIAASCVIVHFAANSNTLNAFMYLRAMLDNTTSAMPAEVYFHTADGFQRAVGQTFVFPSVAPGSHTIRMQYHVGDAATEAEVHSPTIVVLYAP